MIGKIVQLKKKNNWIQGIYRSPKASKPCKFKSSWELFVYKWLDASPLVIKWESECVAIPYVLRGEGKRYYPDILINGNLLIEIKPANQQNSEMNLKKFEAARGFCERRGWVFQVITKKEMTDTFLTEQVINAGKKKI